MRTIRFDYKSVKPNVDELALCLGYFDGVHLGHIDLIKQAKEKANMPLGILTFDKPVSSLINNGKSNDVLTSLDDRFKIVSRFGLDFYYVLCIDHDFLNLSCDEFIDILKKLNVKKVYVGTDYHFGKDRLGNPDTLREHFDVEEIELLQVDGFKVSTQGIISLVQNGEIEKANKLLGHNYMISGVVEQGQKLGKRIGFPTENVKLFTPYVLPKFGVYKTIAYVDNVPHLSITNVGVHPTVGALKEPKIECHIDNYESKDYGKNISIEFLEFVRPERHFSDIEDLKEQISSDVRKVFKR